MSTDNRGKSRTKQVDRGPAFQRETPLFGDLGQDSYEQRYLSQVPLIGRHADPQGR